MSIVERIKRQRTMVQSTKDSVTEANQRVYSSKTIVESVNDFLIGEARRVDLASIILNEKKNYVRHF